MQKRLTRASDFRVTSELSISRRPSTSIGQFFRPAASPGTPAPRGLEGPKPSDVSERAAHSEDSPFSSRGVDYPPVTIYVAYAQGRFHGATFRNLLVLAGSGSNSTGGGPGGMADHGPVEADAVNERRGLHQNLYGPLCGCGG